jgi:hypothetical protein
MHQQVENARSSKNNWKGEVNLFECNQTIKQLITIIHWWVRCGNAELVRVSAVEHERKEINTNRM